MRPGATSWAPQIFSNSVLGIPSPRVSLAAAQAGGDDRQQGGLPGAGVLEVVGQVGVERDAVALRQLVALAVDVEHDGPVLDEGDLAAPRLVHRRVAGAARACTGGERVAAELRALAGEWRGEDLERVPLLGRAAAAALGGTDDRDGAGLVEAQELAELELEARGDPAGDLQRGAGLAPLDLAEHRRGHAAAHGELAQGEVHRLAKRPHARADVDLGLVDERHYARTLSHTVVSRVGRTLV